MSNLNRAIALASEAHVGQLDKSRQPYILHPLRLMMRLESQEERIVAVLHDVVEDCGVSFEALRDMGFSDAVLVALDHLTHRPDESYDDYIGRIAAHPLARRVKIVDLEDNMDVRRLPAPLLDQDWTRLQKYHRIWSYLRSLENG
ncbi:MAG: GTP pyrophosphokinase [Magnetococcales bacterium]|nr:GTP pyrophosphokinase [Magnetococcales bacterium]